MQTHDLTFYIGETDNNLFWFQVHLDGQMKFKSRTYEKKSIAKKELKKYIKKVKEEGKFHGHNDRS